MSNCSFKVWSQGFENKTLALAWSKTEGNTKYKNLYNHVLSKKKKQKTSPLDKYDPFSKKTKHNYYVNLHVNDEEWGLSMSCILRLHLFKSSRFGGEATAGESRYMPYTELLQQQPAELPALNMKQKLGKTQNRKPHCRWRTHRFLQGNILEFKNQIFINSNIQLACFSSSSDFFFYQFKKKKTSTWSGSILKFLWAGSCPSNKDYRNLRRYLRQIQAFGDVIVESLVLIN